MSYWRESVKGEDVAAEYLVQAIFHTSSSTVHRSFARTLCRSWKAGEMVRREAFLVAFSFPAFRYFFF